MTELAPWIITLAALVAVLSYSFRFRGLSHEERLAELRTVARGGQDAARAWVEAEVRRGRGWTKGLAFVVLALGGGLLTPQGRGLVSMVAPMLAVQGEVEERERGPQYTRPEWLDTRVIGGVPQSLRVDALDRDLRQRIVVRLQELPLFDIGGGSVFGDEVGIMFQPLNGMIWREARLPFDWNRFEEGAYLDETADAVARAVEEALR